MGTNIQNLDKSYEEIRKSQISLVSLVETVPGAIVAVLPVTTVKLFRIDTVLTLRRNGREIEVFESFFPEGDTKYMCGISIGNKKDARTYFTEGQRRELLPGLIRQHTDVTVPNSKALSEISSGEA